MDPAGFQISDANYKSKKILPLEAHHLPQVSSHVNGGQSTLHSTSPDPELLGQLPFLQNVLLSSPNINEPSLCPGSSNYQSIFGKRT